MSTMYSIQPSIRYDVFVKWAREVGIIYVRTEEEDNRGIEADIADKLKNCHKWQDPPEPGWEVAYREKERQRAAEYRADQAAGKVLLLHKDRRDFLHTNETSDGYLDIITQYGGNHAEPVLSMIEEHFNVIAIPEYDWESFFAKELAETKESAVVYDEQVE